MIKCALISWKLWLGLLRNFDIKEGFFILRANLYVDLIFISGVWEDIVVIMINNKWQPWLVRDVQNLGGEKKRLDERDIGKKVLYPPRGTTGSNVYLLKRLCIDSYKHFCICDWSIVLVVHELIIQWSDLVGYLLFHFSLALLCSYIWLIVLFV